MISKVSQNKMYNKNEKTMKKVNKDKNIVIIVDLEILLYYL